MRRSIPATHERPAARRAGLGATEIYEGYMAQLLERHKLLCSAAAKS